MARHRIDNPKQSARESPAVPSRHDQRIDADTVDPGIVDDREIGKGTQAGSSPTVQAACRCPPRAGPLPSPPQSEPPLPPALHRAVVRSGPAARLSMSSAPSLRISHHLLPSPVPPRFARGCRARKPGTLAKPQLSGLPEPSSKAEGESAAHPNPLTTRVGSPRCDRCSSVVTRVSAGG